MYFIFEALFSAEYFPYWEFTMVLILFLTVSIIIRLNRIEKQYANNSIKRENDIFELTRERDRLKTLFNILEKNAKKWDDGQIGNIKFCNITKNITEQQ